MRHTIAELVMSVHNVPRSIGHVVVFSIHSSLKQALKAAKLIHPTCNKELIFWFAFSMNGFPKLSHLAIEQG